MDDFSGENPMTAVFVMRIGCGVWKLRLVLKI
jgi:hypothetical protein